MKCVGKRISQKAKLKVFVKEIEGFTYFILIKKLQDNFADTIFGF
jgi:hypothetical protein